MHHCDFVTFYSLRKKIKTNQESDPVSYKPIFLLPITSKIYEKVVLLKMNIIIAEKNLLPSMQYGLGENIQRFSRYMAFLNTITQALENEEFVSAIFLNVSNAFDSVWHQGLFM